MAEQEAHAAADNKAVGQAPFWNPYAAGIALGLVLLMLVAAT